MTHTETLQEIQNNAGNPERVYQLTKAALAQPAPAQTDSFQFDIDEDVQLLMDRDMGDN
jgi:hypothetical protein